MSLRLLYLIFVLCRSKIGSWAVNCAISDVKRPARTR